MPSPSSRSAAGRGIVFMLLIAALLFVFVPWRNETKAELVRDGVTPSLASAIRNGQFIQAKRVGQNLLVTTNPLRGGAEKTLYSLDISQLNVGYMTFTDTEFHFVTSVPPPRTKPFPLSGTGRNVEVPITFEARISQVTSIHNFLQVGNPNSTPPGTIRTQKQDYPIYDPPRETMYRVPLNGNPVKTQTFDWTHIQTHFYAEDAAYSFRSASREYTEVKLPDGKTHNEYLAQTSLYMRPLTGESDRLLRSGLPSVRALDFQTDSAGFSIRTVRPYPDSSYDLIRIPRSGEKPFTIRGYRGYRMPVLHEDRLWWLEFGTILDSPDSLSQKLVSCRLDGSDRQTISINTDADGNQALCVRLDQYRGKFYLVYDRAEESAQARGSAVEEITPPKGASAPIAAAEANGAPGNRILSRYIARLYPNKEELLSKPVALPQKASEFTSAQCDGDYFYYSYVEERTDPLDFLKEKWTMSRVIVLSRIRLPE